MPARFVAVDGWPRYLAVYDLQDSAVLRSPAYRSMTGSGFTAWSRRNLAQIRDETYECGARQPVG